MSNDRIREVHKRSTEGSGRKVTEKSNIKRAERKKEEGQRNQLIN